MNYEKGIIMPVVQCKGTLENGSNYETDCSISVLKNEKIPNKEDAAVCCKVVNSLGLNLN